MSRKAERGIFMRLNMEQLKNLGTVGKNVQAGGVRPATRNPDFPLWKLVMGKKFMVYFPSTPVQTKEVDGETVSIYEPYTYVAHQLSKDGKGGMSVRCVNGICESGSAVAEILGYQGECPACAAMSKCWDAYNSRVETLYKTKGITDTNSKEAKDARAEALNLMPVKNSERYITVPIVVIAEGSNLPKTEDGYASMKAYYFTMREETWKSKFMQTLENNGVETLAGTFWVFDYTKGDTKMKAGKDAVYTYRANLFEGSKDLKVVDKYFENGLIAKCESLAEDFTELNADDNLFVREWCSYDEMQQKLANVMKSTEAYLAAVQSIVTGNAIDTPQVTTQPVGVLGAVADALIKNGGVTAPTETPTPTVPVATPVVAPVVESADEEEEEIAY